MHKIAALIRAGWLAATSYRFGIVMSFASLVIGVVPVYFVTQALQSQMSTVIAGEGNQFFAFIVVGMSTLTVISATLYALPTALQTGTSTGTIEAMLATPTGVPTLLAGLAGYDVLYALLRATVVLVAAAVMGAHLTLDRIGAVLPVLALVILARHPLRRDCRGHGAGLPNARPAAAAGVHAVDVPRRRVLPDPRHPRSSEIHCGRSSTLVRPASDPCGPAGGEAARGRVARAAGARGVRGRPGRRERPLVPGRAPLCTTGRHARAVLIGATPASELA